MLEAIYGKKTKEDKKAAYEGSLQRWWTGENVLLPLPCVTGAAVLTCVGVGFRYSN